MAKNLIVGSFVKISDRSLLMEDCKSGKKKKRKSEKLSEKEIRVKIAKKIAADSDEESISDPTPGTTRSYYSSKKKNSKRRYKEISESSSRSESSSSEDSPSKRRRIKNKPKKNSKRRNKEISESSSDTENTGSEDRNKKLKKKSTKIKKRKKKKKHKKVKKHKKHKIRKENEVEKMNVSLHKESDTETATVGPAIEKAEIPQTKTRSMVPMTKEEYEKQQSILRRVFDPDTGRNRLIKGDGEVIEEIVSYSRQKEINKQATKGDASSFQRMLGLD